MCETALVLLLMSLALAAQPPGSFYAEVLGEGLGTVMVYAVMVAPDGLLHVGTEHGISRFDGRTFSDVVLTDAEPHECFAFGRDGDAAYAQCSDGVWRTEGDSARRLREMTTPSLKAAFSPAFEGGLWLANEAGVFRIRGDEVTPLPTPTGLPDGGWSPRAVWEDAGGLWIGAAQGLFRVREGVADRRADAPVRALLDDDAGLLVGREDGLFDLDGAPVTTAGSCFVTTLAHGADGQLLLGCGDGLQLRDADGTWERLGSAQGLPGTVVRGVTADEEGTLWIAVWKRGLVRVSEPGVRLWSGPSLRVDPVSEVQRAGDTLYVNGWDGGWQIGPELTPQPLEMPPGSDDLPAFGVAAGATYTYTGLGIWRHTDAWVQLTEREALWGLTFARDGRVWASDNEGIHQVDGPTRLPHPPDALHTAVLSGGADGVYVIGGENVWTVSADGLQAYAPAPPGCTSGGLFDVADERWLQCDRALYRREQGHWVRWEGPGDGEIMRAGVVDGEEFWISTANRLVRVRPDPLSLDRSNGLPPVNFLPNRGLARFGEWVVAACAEGVLWVRPESLARVRPAPAPRVLSVEARGRTLTDLGALEPEDDFLTVHLATDRLGDPARTRFRFRLDEGAWSTPSSGDLLQLPGLQAGDHTLVVEAAAGASGWSATAATLAFHLPPYWWERGEVRAGGALLLVVLSWVYWRERHRRVVEALEGLQEIERVRQTFGRFVTPEVAEEALAGRLSTRGESREVTILFADLRGFTPLTEAMEPVELVALLNDWLTGVVAAIEAEGGVVNKFVGDAVVAIFGAPRAQADHAERAVRAGRRLAGATAEVAARSGRDLRAGVGINSGMVIAGPVGAASRMEYTVIGEAVNVAARVEALTRSLDAEVLVTQATLDRLPDPHGAEDLGAHTLKGVGRPVRVWRVRPAG